MAYKDTSEQDRKTSVYVCVCARAKVCDFSQLLSLTVTQCLLPSCLQVLFQSQRINRCDGLLTGTTHWRHTLSNNNTSYSDPFQSLSASHNLFSHTVRANTTLLLTL